MSHPPKKLVERTRKSVFFRPESLDGTEGAILRNLYPYMLWEDLRLGIVPYRGAAEDDDPVVLLTPSDSRVATLIEAGISSEGHTRDLADSVLEFIREATGSLSAFGEAYYEIDYAVEESNGETVLFQLEQIATGTVMNRAGRYVQVVPAPIASEFGVPSEIALVTEHLLLLELSPERRRTITEAMRDLSILSGNIVPKFALEYALNDPSRPPFDESDYIRTRKLAIAQVTRRLGWDARATFASDLLEYYQIERLLRFARIKAELRTLILDGLNECLGRIGHVMGFDAATHLRISGLPTVEEVDSAVSSLQDGTRPFKDIVKRFI